MNDTFLREMVCVDDYTEGVVSDGDGRVFFSCMNSGEIRMLDTEGSVHVWAHLSRPNGHIIRLSGEHLICETGTASICRYDATGNFIARDVHLRCAGRQFTTPNDLVADADGGYYFSDSVTGNGCVFYRSANGVERLVASGINYPNGVALSSDGGVLYVAESYLNRIVVIMLDDAGVAKEKQFSYYLLPFHSSGKMEQNLPDGIKVDSSGNLWIAHYGMGIIQVISSTGKHIASIDAGYRCCSNLFLVPDGCIVSGAHTQAGPGGLFYITGKNFFLKNEKNLAE